MILVKIMGSVSSEMALLGSITNIKNAIAAAGNPMPRKPLMMPANKKIAITEIVIARSCDGKMSPLIQSIMLLSATASSLTLG